MNLTPLLQSTSVTELLDAITAEIKTQTPDKITLLEYGLAKNIDTVLIKATAGTVSIRERFIATDKLLAELKKKKKPDSETKQAYHQVPEDRQQP